MCTCPSRALIQEDIYDAFMARALKRVAAIKMGNPLDPSVALGAQNSKLQARSPGFPARSPGFLARSPGFLARFPGFLARPSGLDGLSIDS